MTSREEWHPGIIFLSFTLQTPHACLKGTQRQALASNRVWVSHPSRADSSFLTADLLPIRGSKFNFQKEEAEQNKTAMPQNVVLDGPAPWGFRLSGGKDFNQPLTITRVTPGSKASRVNLCPGDIILSIQGASTDDMTHADAQNKIKDSTNQLVLKIERPETKMWSPQVIEEGKVNPFKINLEAEKQEFKPIGTGHNRRAQPFVAAASLDDKTQVVSSTYNTPIGLYSQDNIQDALQGQIRGLVHEKPEGPKPLTSIEDSHVYRMLQENQEESHEPRQSGSFKALQDYVESDGTRPMVTRSVKAPVTKPQAATSSLQKLPLCDKCGTGIVGPVVKARDKYRHPACFVCSDCGLNLKQKGYFFVEGQMYCEAHARMRMAPPEGHDLVTVYPTA
ncbi:PDZ and LIM domain protein 3b isoform X2 [Garra rufa]|uniref:PDZ and LIM domain protein 3b isoform X2 n=1 Tax=Garra rufa TaxID=137080 RepID=UPI003CCEEB4F